MFELLLQADKALAGGLLDQAEKTYWQLIELDPTNAIAVSGLALIALERGDERMARDFAERALGIDPESTLARRVVETIEHKTATPSGYEPPDLPLLAVEQLEAIGRRRGKGGAAGAAAGPARTHSVEEPAAVPESAVVEAEAVEPIGVHPAAAVPAPGAALAGRLFPVHAPKGERAKVAPTVPPASSRGKTAPGQIGPLPAEPLAERRRAGRMAAAAAAAAAAARAPVRPRHDQPHPQPVGKYHVALGSLKTPPPDQYSAAEMAAAVAAVDALDDASLVSMAAAEAEAEAAAAAASFEATAARDDYDLLGGTGDYEDSVALRIALLSGDVAQFADENSDDYFEAAEAAAGPSPREMAATQIYLVDTDEFAAAEAEAEAVVSAGAEPDFGDAAEAEAAAETEALREVANAAAHMDQEPVAKRRYIEPVADGESSEEEAEAAALREAMAIVLSGDGEAGGGSPARPQAANQTGAEAETTAEPIPGPPDQPAETPQPDDPEQKNAAEAGHDDSAPAQRPRKSGIFHRRRGN